MRRIAVPRAGWSDFAVETVVVQRKIDFKHCPYHETLQGKDQS